MVFSKSEDANLKFSSATALLVGKDAVLDQSGVQVMVAGGEVQMDQSGAVLLASRKVSLENSGVVFLIAGKVEGDVNPVFGTKDFILFGLIAGISAGVVMTIAALFKKPGINSPTCPPQSRMGA